MPKFMVDHSFHARASKIVEASSLEEAEAAVEAETYSDNFEIEADQIDDVDFTVREMFPITRNGKEMWTTYVRESDVRGHQSALTESPLFSGAS